MAALDQPGSIFVHVIMVRVSAHPDERLKSASSAPAPTKFIQSLHKHRITCVHLRLGRGLSNGRSDFMIVKKEVHFSENVGQPSKSLLGLLDVSGYSFSPYRVSNHLTPSSRGPDTQSEALVKHW